MAEPLTFGQFFKELRIRSGKTLRQFCVDNGWDPGNMSKLERGLLPAPDSRERLVAYARALGLTEGSDDWLQFFDLAFVSRGQIPPEVLEEEELVKQLPIVFRALRGRISAQQADELIDLIRRNVT